jgi:hypothetical protein
MRLPVEKIQAAILHPEEEVRLTAVRYFVDSASGDASIMPLVIQAVEKYGRGSSFRILRDADDLLQTASTLDWLIQELRRDYDLQLVPDDISSVRPIKSPPKYPIGTVALYGPDDKLTTKIVAGVVKREDADAIVERWVGTNIKENPKVQRKIQEFFARHGVKSVVATDANFGCPHEEGLDFPSGEDCPFCPFWAGKQGSNSRD